MTKGTLKNLSRYSYAITAVYLNNSEHGDGYYCINIVCLLTETAGTKNILLFFGRKNGITSWKKKRLEQYRMGYYTYVYIIHLRRGNENGGEKDDDDTRTLPPRQ